MFRRFSINFALFSMFLDGLLVDLALIIAITIRPALSSLPSVAPINQPIELPVILYILFPVIWVSVLLLFNLYDGRKNLRVTDELATLTTGSLLAGVALAGALYLSYREISRFMFFIFVTTTFVMQLSWRLAARQLFRQNSGTSIPQRKVLIAGAGPVGKKMEKEINAAPLHGLVVAGFVDDDQSKRLKARDILGATTSVRQVVKDHQIDDVVIALPRAAHQRVNYLVAELHDMPVKVWVIPDYFQLALHKAVVEEFAGIPMLDLRAPALNDYQRMVKRAFDMLLVVVGIIPASFLMGLIAIIIKLDSPGPVIFSQWRVGENGKLFRMFKFRTMVQNADQMRHLTDTVDDEGNLIHKRKDDPRVTGAGRFLRRTSLDELPQIWNVIKGDISIVGPRPELPDLVSKYQPWQHTRFAVPQGITGWWQVNGRSDKPMHLHTDEDLYYVQHYSLWLDIQILLKTIWTVFRGRGAF